MQARHENLRILKESVLIFFSYFSLFSFLSFVRSLHLKGSVVWVDEITSSGMEKVCNDGFKKRFECVCV